MKMNKGNMSPAAAGQYFIFELRGDTGMTVRANNT